MTLEQRSLSSFESLFYRVGIGPVVATVTLEGQVDATVMDQAARLLQRDYPLLRSSFHETGEGVGLVAAEEGPGLAIVSAPDQDTLTNELNVSLGRNRPVSRITLSQTAQSSVLSLAGDHAASDARLNTLLLHRLLGYYRDLVSGATPKPIAMPSWAETLEDVLLAQYEPAQDQPAGAGDADPPVMLGTKADAPGALAVRAFSYERDTTAALIAAARGGALSITNLLTGALACAVRAQFPADAGPMPVSPAFAVDLRSRVAPPISPDAPFCCVARLVCATHVDTDDQPAEVGRRISTQLRAALDRDEIQRRIVAQRLAGRPLPIAPMSFMVSNIGLVEDYPLPGGLRVIDSRWATTSRGPVPTLFGSTVGGRLTLDLVYDTAFQQADVIDELAKHFEAALLASRS